MHGYFDRMNRWSWFAGNPSRFAVSRNWALRVIVAILLFAGFVSIVENTGPAILILGFLAALYLFARAWVRQFYYLMRLGDSVFPGRNDKLIWAMLLIVMPPVGLLLFGSYRRAHWGDAKPPHAADDLD